MLRDGHSRWSVKPAQAHADLSWGRARGPEGLGLPYPEPPTAAGDAGVQRHSRRLDPSRGPVDGAVIVEKTGLPTVSPQSVIQGRLCL